MDRPAETARPAAPATAPSVTAPAAVEAWRARKTYPSTLLAGGPVFGVARERRTGGWVLQPHFAGLAPQDARDGLGSYFRAVAERRRGDGDPAAAEYAAAGDL
ncbi:MAG: PE-PGRS family protein, partial [Streptomyces sp.]|nr:PE-PGRS family protein [Streptomyces sp.]